MIQRSTRINRGPTQHTELCWARKSYGWQRGANGHRSMQHDPPGQTTTFGRLWQFVRIIRDAQGLTFADVGRILGQLMVKAAGDEADDDYCKVSVATETRPAVRSRSKEVSVTLSPLVEYPTAIWLQRTYPKVLLVCLCYSATSQHHSSFSCRIRRCRADGGHR